MAEGRMLKKRIAKSRKLAAAKPLSRLLYLMILPHLDIEGRIEGDPLLVRAQCIPYFNWAIKQVDSFLEDLANVGLILLYTFEEETYIEFVRFDSFQNLRTDREAPSTIPAPTPGVLRESSGVKVKVKLSKDKVNTSHPPFVCLTTEEYDLLVGRYGEKTTKDYIERLNDYIDQIGIEKANKRYKSHAAVIKNWYRKDQLDAKPKTVIHKQASVTGRSPLKTPAFVTEALKQIEAEKKDKKK